MRIYLTVEEDDDMIERQFTAFEGLLVVEKTEEWMFMGGCSEFYRQRRDLIQQRNSGRHRFHLYHWLRNLDVVNSPLQSRFSLSNAIYYTSTAKNMVYNGGE